MLKLEMEMKLDIPFATAREAEIAFDALRVEVEPARSRVKRRLELSGAVLTANFVADSARSLRVSVNGFLEHVVLVTQTLSQFGPPL